MRGGEVARTFLRSRASLAGDLARPPGTHSCQGSTPPAGKSSGQTYWMWLKNLISSSRVAL
jgi:hypothetical protein